ncbi:hypothetical protein [Ralstonia sp. 1B3]|uniref:hypothetical protein n=1 Tax=Ralstonia sp. 1B3 TaxID=2997421 RepID=UPI002FC87233
MQPKRLTATLLVLASALGAHSAFAQAAGVHRTDLVHHDLSVPGRETLQVRVDFDERAFAPRMSTLARKSPTSCRARSNTGWMASRP